MSPIFARTRHVYDSYTDFWRLVELSGYDTCFIDEIKLDADKSYIFTPWNGEVEPYLVSERKRVSSKTARVVWWNLEMMSEEFVRDMKNVDRVAHLVDSIWVSDRSYQQRHPRFSFVFLGSHPGLRECAQRAIKYDFVHMSYAWGRRKEVYDKMRSSLCEGPNGWGKVRAETLASSRLLVNVHQRPSPAYAPLRFALAAAYELPVLSETFGQVPNIDADEHYVQADIKDIYRASIELVNDGARRASLGHALYNRLCKEWPFQRGVEEGLRVLNGVKVAT